MIDLQDGTRYAKVVIDSPLPQLDRLFEYAVPPGLNERVRAGIRVKVPLRTGGRIVSGYVVDVSDEPEYAGKLAELHEVVSETQVLPAALYRLARAVADRQAGTVSDVLRLAVPARSARLEGEWLQQQASDQELNEDARHSADPPEVQRVPEFAEVAPAEFVCDTVAALCESPPKRLAMRPAVGVTEDLPNALIQCVAIAAQMVGDGRSAILCVPDYRDVELALEIAHRLLPSSAIRRFDARLKPKPRYHEYLQTLEPRPQLVIGTRTAVYAPVHNLGCIVVWNDDDESFIEPRAPYQHTREVASIRAVQESCGLIFAAHSPSLAVTRLVNMGWCALWHAPGKRAPRVIPAAATLSDDPAAGQARIPSAAWRAAKVGVETGPVLIQVGRAGYLPGLACARCFAIAHCQNCQGTLAQAHESAPPACTVCGMLHGNWRCEECGNSTMRARGTGHQRTAEELGRAFPNTPIVVADGDRELIRIGDEPALVVATRGAEPVALHGYRAVILLDTEGALARETLDAQTDAMRAWSNAAALVAEDGQVVITGEQSAPILALRDWKQPLLCQQELEQRFALGFPPAQRLLTVTGTSDEVTAMLRRLNDLVPNAGDALTVLGPTAMPDEPAVQRAVVRFSYRAGELVARAAKAELVAQATGGRRTAGKARASSTLRVHFDAHDVF